MGLGPLVMEPGYVIAILFGCDVPVVLRETGAGYLFAGPCYLEGVMEGQYVQRLRDSGTLESDTEHFLMV